MKSFINYTALASLILASAFSVSAERVFIKGSVVAASPCDLFPQCPEKGREMFACTQALAPVVGNLSFTDKRLTRKPVTVSASGTFRARVRPGKYYAKFSSFDGVGYECTKSAVSGCEKVMTSSGFVRAEEIEVSDLTVVTGKSSANKRITLSAKASACGTARTTNN